MSFTKPEYCLFLVAVLILYYCLTRRAQNVLLLLASYVFYACWDWRFLSLIWLSTLVDYAVARRLDRAQAPGRRRLLLGLSVGVNLSILGFFKYFNFFAAGAGSLLAAVGLAPGELTLKILLPVGISFYTFQTMSYTIDVYRRRRPAEKDPLDFALFVAFFPQLVAGPIERADRLLPQFKATRRATWDDWCRGGQLIILGYFLKRAVADSIAPVTRDIFAAPGEQGWGMLLSGLYLFALQIYCDFAGYSKIARGSAKLLGIDLMENFRQPYLARSVTEFWHRWHISLSAWLKDYVYIPLGGNRRGNKRTYANLVTTMLVGGLWHGAALPFVIWGGLHGLYLAAHKALAGRDRSSPAPTERPWRLADVGKALATFHLVCLTWVFFQPDLGVAWTYLARLLSFRGSNHFHPWVLPALAVVLLINLAQQRGRDFFFERLPWAVRGAVYAGMLYACLLLGNSHEPFIYFQF